jgi:integrase/recombinase XerD
MTTRYRAWRAVSPSDGASTWVIVDEDFELHDGGCAFLTGLRAADRSVNTERVYAGRVALFLSWCATEGVDWTRPRLDHMVGFKRWLVAEPAATREDRPRRRSTKSADAVLRTVCEFLRFGARHELVDAAVVDRLFEPRFLKFLPAGFEPGEDGQQRSIRSRLLRFAVAEEPFSFIEPERVDDLVAAAGNVRDRFLVTLVAMTGLRIGEALGLHREDMHFLSDSRTLGCKVVGPHLHVRRRPDNPNGALAKSRFSRSVPVAETAVSLYADYAHERHACLGDADVSPLVFINLYRAPLGGPLRYPNAKDMFDRLARRTGLVVRPHLLRHTAATTWLRQGTPRDTVQALLGHVSPSSMQPYFHPDEADKRAAVERGAAWAEGQR